MIIVLIAAGAGLSLVDSFHNRAVAKALKSREARDRQELAALQSRMTANESSSSGLSVRVGSLEAKAASVRDPADIAKQVQPSVFTIVTGDALGSGWVASVSGTTSRLVTNFHVIADTWSTGRRSVRVKQGDSTFDGTITAVDQTDDLAIVDVAVALPPLAIETERPPVGDAVLVVGSPLGLGGSVASGIVSAFRDDGGQQYMQFSAPISPGNSGGPVVNRVGKVVGVSVLKLVGDNAEGLAFAIPASYVCSGLHLC